jgi:hypothetical protein
MNMAASIPSDMIVPVILAISRKHASAEGKKCAWPLAGRVSVLNSAEPTFETSAFQWIMPSLRPIAKLGLCHQCNLY